jgi:AraC-like DNA-binding protein
VGTPAWTVAHLVTSPAAGRRLADALALEGLRGQPLTPQDLRVGRGIGRRTAAFVFDLAPWNQSAVALLRRIRADHADLPVLLYAPIRVGVARLLTECAECAPLWAELQHEGPAEADRLARVLREVLSSHRQAQVLRRVSLVLRDLPDDVTRFCRTALRTLGAADPGRRFSVEAVAAAMGVSRRYLERAFKRKRMMRPNELLDWVILLSAAALADDRRTGLYAAGPILGVERARLRRVRKRLWSHGLDFESEGESSGEFQDVMAGFWMRCAGLRHGGGFQIIGRTNLRTEPLRTPTPRGPRWVVHFTR